MTIKVDSLQFFMYVNVPNLPVGDVDVTFTSLYSDQAIISQLGSVTESNDRYSTISVFLNEDLSDKRYTGIYKYTVSSGSTTYDTGLAKMIFPGGAPDIRQYISNNETGQSVVYYTPEN